MPDDETLDVIIENALRKMDFDQKQHFKGVCAVLLSCYSDPGYSGLVVVGSVDPDSVTLTDIFSLGCNDITAMQLLASVQARIGIIVMNDAPPREMYS